MEGLSTLVNLRVLDVAANKLSEISDIEKLTLYVWVHIVLELFLYALS